MKSIIKSIRINKNVVTVVTKSNVVRTYTLQSNENALNFVADNIV